MTGLKENKTKSETYRFSEISGCSALTTLKSRKEFKAVSNGHHVFRNGLILQALPRHLYVGEEIRFGCTCSKKVGNAVIRNRAKRRLRAIARIIIPNDGLAGWDYVLIGRAKKTVELSFDKLKLDLEQALITIHKTSAQ